MGSLEQKLKKGPVKMTEPLCLSTIQYSAVTLICLVGQLFQTAEYLLAIVLDIFSQGLVGVAAGTSREHLHVSIEEKH